MKVKNEDGKIIEMKFADIKHPLCWWRADCSSCKNCPAYGIKGDYTKEQAYIWWRNTYLNIVTKATITLSGDMWHDYEECEIRSNKPPKLRKMKVTSLNKPDKIVDNYFDPDEQDNDFEYI